jgi:hypothetical protein
MAFVFWYSQLQPEVTAEAYEQWVRAVDYPGAADVESIIIYRVHRVLGPFVGEPLADYDYVEIAEVTAMDEYLQDLEEHPAVEPIVTEIGDYVQSVGSAWGVPTEDE